MKFYLKTQKQAFFFFSPYFFQVRSLFTELSVIWVPLLEAAYSVEKDPRLMRENQECKNRKHDQIMKVLCLLPQLFHQEVFHIQTPKNSFEHRLSPAQGIT